MRVPRIYTNQTLSLGEEVTLPKNSSRHLVSVLRMKVGQSAILFNGEGGEFIGKLTNASKTNSTVLIGPEGSIVKTIAFNATDNELGAYLLKRDRTSFNIAGKLSLNEWRGQKNVEFIIDDISVNKNIKNMVPSSIG